MADLDLKATIELLIKGGNVPKDVGDKLRKLAQDAEHAKRASERLSKSISLVNEAIGAVGVTVGIGALISFARSAFVEFAKTERIFGAVENQLKALGDRAGYTGEQMRDLIGGMSEQYGILDDDLIPAYNRLLVSFGDGKAAMSALDIASQFAANGLGDVQGNAEALSQAMQTGVLRGLSKFGIQTKDATGDALELSAALVLIREKQATLGKTLGDAQDKLNQMSLLWDSVRDASGAAIDVVLTKASSFGEKMADMSKSVGLFFAGIAPAEFERDRGLTGEGLGASGAIGEATAAEEDPLKRLFRELDAKRAKAKADEEAADARKKAEEDEVKRQEKLRAVEEDRYNRKYEQLKRIGDEERRMAEGQAALDAKADEYNRARFESEEAAALEAQAALDELKLLAAEALNQELFDANIRAAIVQDEELERLRVEALEREKAQKLAAVTEGSEAAFAIAKFYDAKITATHADHTKKRIKWAEMERDQKIQLAGQIMQDVGTILGSIFAKNKSVAIAAAIIDTIGAGIKAFYQAGGWPAGALPLAVTLAMGYARVSQMRSTNVGSDGGSSGGGSAPASSGASVARGKSGFDDPVNDRMAYLGGRRWASDFVRNTAQGFADGLDGGSRGPSSTNPAIVATGAGGTTVHIDLRGSRFADRRSMRKFVRQLRRSVPGADASNLQ